MKYTTNKNLNLPEYTDTIDIEHLNENFKTIDAHFTDADAHNEKFAALDSSLRSAIQSAFQNLLVMVMSGLIQTELATSDGVAIGTSGGEELVAVRKI